jgi:hypothetical protein
MTRIPLFADIDGISESPLNKPQALGDDDLLRALQALAGLEGTGEARRKREVDEGLPPLMIGVELRSPETGARRGRTRQAPAARDAVDAR